LQLFVLQGLSFQPRTIGRFNAETTHGAGTCNFAGSIEHAQRDERMGIAVAGVCDHRDHQAVSFGDLLHP